MKFIFFATLLFLPFPVIAQEVAVEPTTEEIQAEQSDGGSAFADNLLTRLNDAEYVSYLKAFIAVMEKGEPHKTYQWSTKNAVGKIAAGPVFITRTKQSCRGFSESYAVGKESQFSSGMVCRNGKGGWCKLRPTSTPSCRLGHPDGIAGVMLDTNIAIDSMNNKATQMNNRFNSFKANLPF